jgi:hypothetical protein
VGEIFEALFGLVRLGSLIKFAPQLVMAGFQNTAAHHSRRAIQLLSDAVEKSSMISPGPSN